jgi:small ligand-binding sensory domain FIST
VASAGVVAAASAAPDAGSSAAEAAGTARDAAGLTAPDAVWLALGGPWAAAGAGASPVEAALAGIESVWPGVRARTVATHGAGLLGSHGEWREQPAVGVLGLGGAGITSFSVDELAGEEDRAGPEAVARLGIELEPGDAVVVWADAAGLAPEPLLASLSGSLAPAVLVGGALSPPAGEEPGLFHAGRALRSGLVGWHLPGSLGPRVAVANACHALTPPLPVSRARGHWLLGLGGRPALDVFREAAGAPLARDPGRAARVLKVAVLEDGSSAALDVRVVHNVVGFDAGRNAFSVARPIESGRRVMLVQLDADRARAGLDGAIGHLAAQVAEPDFALYFGCRGRGETLFGIDGLEAGLIERGLAGTPWLGTVADYQIAPGSGGATASHPLTYAGVLIVTGPKGARSRE